MIADRPGQDLADGQSGLEGVPRQPTSFLDAVPPQMGGHGRAAEGGGSLAEEVEKE